MKKELCQKSAYLKKLKFHFKLEKFLEVLYLLCKIVFCCPETHKHAQKKIRLIGRILFCKTKKFKGGAKTHAILPPRCPHRGFQLKKKMQEASVAVLQNFSVKNLLSQKTAYTMGMSKIRKLQI